MILTHIDMAQVDWFFLGTAFLLYVIIKSLIERSQQAVTLAPRPAANLRASVFHPHSGLR